MNKILNSREIWDRLIDRMDRSAVPPRITGYLTQAVPSTENNTFIISFQNTALASVLDDPEVYAQIRDVIFELADNLEDIRIVISPDIVPLQPAQTEAAKNTEVTDEITEAEKPFPEASPLISESYYSNSPHDFSTTGLNPKFTFENFVVGKSNELARAAGVAAAEKPGKNYNPLFIYGESGVGKTHLMHSIGNYAKDLFPSLRVKYVSSEDFTNDFINSVSSGTSKQFQEKYRQIDILMIDDIQFLQKKQETQESFFHTFNSLHNSNRQLIISSDLPPKQLMGFEERMRSRFDCGLVCDIQKPDLETRIAILQKKCQSEEQEVNIEVLEYLASRVSNNVRELEGTLLRVFVSASFEKEEITIDFVKRILTELGDPQSDQIDPIEIIEITAKHYSLAVDDLCGNSRVANISTARQIAMYLCRELTEISLPKLGEIFGRDHSTIIYATRRIANLLGKDRAIFDDINQLTQFIRKR